MPTFIGSSFCGGCDRPIETELTGENEPRKCCNGHGRWWRIAPNQYCVCGALQEWLHQPPPEALEWTVEMPQRQKIYS